RPPPRPPARPCSKAVILVQPSLSLIGPWRISRPWKLSSRLRSRDSRPCSGAGSHRAYSQESRHHDRAGRAGLDTVDGECWGRARSGVLIDFSQLDFTARCPLVSALRLELLSGLLDRGLLVRTYLGVAEIEPVAGRGNDSSHQAAGDPFVIGGNDVPGCPFRAGRPESLLVGLHVVVPEAALEEVCRRELPVFPGIFKPLEKSLTLFVLGDVQEELEHHCAVAGQVPLQSIDVFIAVSPEVVVDLDVGDPRGLDQLRMHSDDQDLLVIGAVEDADPSPFG